MASPNAAVCDIRVGSSIIWPVRAMFVDTLNPRAIDRFIELTHEAYYRELGESFGDTVPAIFTDEPQFCHKQTLGFAGEKKTILSAKAVANRSQIWSW